MHHQQITTLFPNLGPKATPHPPQIGSHFFLCMRMPYCGKLTSGMLNSPSSRSSKLAPPPTGNRTSPVHHSNLHWQNRGLATNLSKQSTKFILWHPSCKTSGERSLRWSVWIQSPSFSYHMPGRTSAWIFEQVCSHLVYLQELNSDFFRPISLRLRQQQSKHSSTAQSVLLVFHQANAGFKLTPTTPNYAPSGT